MLKKCTVLFVSCLSCVVTPSQAEFTVKVPLTPIQETLNSNQQDHCDLPTLRSQPIEAALDHLYQAMGYIPIWQQQQRVAAFQDELNKLGNDGLNPAEYSMSSPASDNDVCAELQRSAHYLRALEHLSLGRLDQQEHEAVWESDSVLPLVQMDVAGLGIVGLENMSQAFELARPDLPLYRQLRDAYQQMSSLPAERMAFPSGSLLKPGNNDPRLPLLAQRMVLDGYLLPGASDDPLDGVTVPEAEQVQGQPLAYDKALQQAVKAFQTAHGLQPDAVVGPQTVAALNISPQQRQQQVRINLERLRWSDARRQHHSLLVNAAGSRAILYEGNNVRWQSRVQSGTPDRATPLLDSRINRVTLNPSWTIPPTIMREDKLPQIRTNPDYFAERNLSVLDAQGNPLSPEEIDWDNPHGVWLREPPGPNNPLGRMVFRFDNPFAVFLHDTPSQSLFARAVRNVSSGCVRVEQADELADYLFYSLDQQQRERIEQRMASSKTHEIRVKNGPQVLLTYWTAEGDEDGSLRFSPDPYGLDAPLIEAFHQATGMR